MRQIGANQVALVSTLGPVMTLLLGWLKVREHVAVAAGWRGAGGGRGGQREFAQRNDAQGGVSTGVSGLQAQAGRDGKPRA